MLIPFHKYNCYLNTDSICTIECTEKITFNGDKSLIHYIVFNNGHRWYFMDECDIRSFRNSNSDLRNYNIYPSELFIEIIKVISNQEKGYWYGN